MPDNKSQSEKKIKRQSMRQIQKVIERPAKEKGFLFKKWQPENSTKGAPIRFYVVGTKDNAYLMKCKDKMTISTDNTNLKLKIEAFLKSKEIDLTTLKSIDELDERLEKENLLFKQADSNEKTSQVQAAHFLSSNLVFFLDLYHLKSSELATIIGTSATTISSLKDDTGHSDHGFYLIDAIAQYFGVTASELVKIDLTQLDPIEHKVRAMAKLLQHSEPEEYRVFLAIVDDLREQMIEKDVFLIENRRNNHG